MLPEQNVGAEDYLKENNTVKQTQEQCAAIRARVFSRTIAARIVCRFNYSLQ